MEGGGAPDPPEKPAKPPKQGLGLLRQKQASQVQGHAGPPSASLEQRRKRMAQTFSGLGAMASKLSVIIAQPEIYCEELHRFGFACIKTSSQFMESFDPATDCPPHVGGIIIASSGTDFSVSLECCRFLDQFTNSPPSLAVLVMPGEEPQDDTEMTQIVKTFLETGADNVVALHGQETISAVRVHEAILRSEIMVQKASAMINHQVEAVRKKASKTVLVAWKRFLWDLVGKVLENIPAKDSTLQERIEENVGVGDYAFTCRLGSGTFGVVFKAEHPTHGTRALKVIAKSTVQNVCQLLSIDSELCIMRNLPAHPNVARAREAFHNEGHIILVMDYCGDLNLQNYIVMVLKSTGGGTLPQDTVESFCTQEAAAVGHLHAFMVCHRDLKPTNFIVSNDASTLRLTDFGLAVMSCGPSNKLLHCCGTLPFAAPEVQRLQERLQDERKTTAVGYNGFSADIWSLAVNYLELAYGLYSTERLLGWVPQPPPDPQQRFQDIERFCASWHTVVEMVVPGLRRVLGHMFRLQPEERWSIGQILGSEGLNVGELVHQSSAGSAWCAQGDPAAPRAAGFQVRHSRGRADDDAEADELAVPLDSDDILGA